LDKRTAQVRYFVERVLGPQAYNNYASFLNKECFLVPSENWHDWVQGYTHFGVNEAHPGYSLIINGERKIHIDRDRYSSPLTALIVRHELRHSEQNHPMYFDPHAETEAHFSMLEGLSYLLGHQRYEQLAASIDGMSKGSLSDLKIPDARRAQSMIFAMFRDAGSPLDEDRDREMVTHLGVLIANRNNPVAITELLEPSCLRQRAESARLTKINESPRR